MKHNESLGTTTKIAKIIGLTLFIFVNRLKKSKDLFFFSFFIFIYLFFLQHFVL